jgi:hypothetical protein
MKYYQGKEKIDIVNLPKGNIISGIKKPTAAKRYSETTKTEMGETAKSPWVSWEDAIKLKKEIARLQDQIDRYKRALYVVPRRCPVTGQEICENGSCLKCLDAYDGEK